MSSTGRLSGVDSSLSLAIAMIESSCMMLDYIEEKEIAVKIRKAVAEVN